METSQNLLKISTVSPPDSLQADRQRRISTVSPPDTSRETATSLTDDCNNNRMVKLSPFD